MNRIVLDPPAVSIEEDFALWSAEQAALLRDGRLDALDRENLAEEIESLGRSQEDEIESRLLVLLHHLLKWQFQPEGRSNSWKATILEQRSRIRRRIRQSPSLRDHPLAVLAEEYALARLKASGETGLPEDAFPATARSASSRCSIRNGCPTRADARPLPSRRLPRPALSPIPKTANEKSA